MRVILMLAHVSIRAPRAEGDSMQIAKEIGVQQFQSTPK